jgi:uncharacterized membrane protein YkoI
MKRNHILTLAASVLVLVMIGACAQLMHSNDEKTIALDQAPAAVQSAIEKTLAGQKAEKIVVEQEDGKTTYEATYHVNGQERTAEFSAAGELIEVESDVDASALPAAVTGAIQKTYPAAKITEAATVSAGGQQYYEAGIKLSDGKEREMQINADGSIRADKAEESEKDEK